jgi:very-short-patch-repair endonuclease
MTKSQAEILFAKHLKELGLGFRTNVPVVIGRRWRWDFELSSHRIAIEIDGYFKGRHGAGWGADNEKRNTGTMLGWRVLVFSTNYVFNGKAKEFLEDYLK